MGEKVKGAGVMKSIVRRHALDTALMGVLSADTAEGSDMMFRKGIYVGGYERGVETATRAMMEQVADGSLSQADAQALLAAAERAASKGA